VAKVARAGAKPKQRVSAAERRDELIDAAIEEFSVSGLHGTPVERIARRVGVTQPYVFSLFATKRDLFIAAMERCFARVTEEFTGAAERAAAGGESGGDVGCVEGGDTKGVDNPVLEAIAARYVELLESDRSMLMAQLQAYAACNDEVIREHVARSYRALVARVQELAGVDDARVSDFMGHGAYLTIQAAMHGSDLSALTTARGTVR